jgi:uncharacterized protein (TIGR03083 family)
MDSFDADELLDQLRRDGVGLAQAAERAGWDARVEACDWTVRELVTHVGGVHRWAADIVRTAAASPDTEAGRAVGTGPSDDELLDWYRAGHAALVDALAGAPSDLEAFTFLPAPSPRHFWIRRQAHETAIHRADAESAASTGTVSPAFPEPFAQDGIDEMLRGFAARRSNAVDARAVLGLRPSDGPSWRVSFDGARNEAEPGDVENADAVVSGSSSDLYLWLWNRPSAASVTGDQSVAGRWRAIQVRWS